MRIYQRQKNNKYILPQVVYHQTIWQIRDYYRLQEMAKDILLQSQISNRMPIGTGVTDSVGVAAIKRERILEVIGAIDAERDNIPKEYRNGVWGNILFGRTYPLDADRSTYGRYKSRFVHNVAKRLFLI